MRRSGSPPRSPVMAGLWNKLVVVLLLFAECFVCDVSTSQRAQKDCAGDEVNLHIIGSLNGTGRPLVQARLEQPATSEPRRLHVRVRDEPCAPDGTVRRIMRAVVYGPHSGDPLPTPQRLQQDPNPRLNEIEAVVNSSSPLQESGSVEESTVNTTNSVYHRDVDAQDRFSGYTKVANIGRYKVHQEKVTWGRAALACAREGATLAVPHSQREVDALWQLKQSAPLPRSAADRARPRNFMDVAVLGLERMTYLVGVRRYPGHDNFTTIFGDELSETGYSTWAIPPPNEEHCGAMVGNTGLRTVTCESNFPFICELPL